METLNNTMAALNAFLWHDIVLYVILLTGIVLTVWSGFCQYRALTHGTRVLRGQFDDANDPGAISHFQAMSAALSATVGLGNIGGVALAISLGGPGAVFWMWIMGLVGMAIKLTEVTLSMLYRNTDDPENPHGGPMWVASKGLARLNPGLAGFGKFIGGLFCVTLLVATITGGNMFQAWNVATLSESYFGIPGIVTGLVLAVLVGLVILGGIKRIGAVAARLVPSMCALYLLAGTYVLIVNAGEIPAMFGLIFSSAWGGAEASGAFIGGTVAYALLFGIKRAIFSNEVGQGTSAIAHSAAKTDEPVREGVVGGLEPFIDTLVVCTFTALVLLSTGVWNRSAEAQFDRAPTVVPVELGVWSIENTPAPPPVTGDWRDGQPVFMIVSAEVNENTGNNLHRLSGTVLSDGDGYTIEWTNIVSQARPRLDDLGVYGTYAGATLTARAFDSVFEGLGKWLITLAAWLFAISTMISWSYYGEQGVVFLLGERAVTAYKLVYCVLIVIATLGFITTDKQLDNLSGIGAGLMLLVSLPIIWIFSSQAMRVYKNYIRRLDTGDMGSTQKAPPLEDIISGKDST